jgi:phenylpropionate dioxygenase-like ring-hydroxylating dioxygenase large terminal subunit
MRRYPFTSFPEGWFFVCHAAELAGDKLFSRKYQGEEIIAYRDAMGVARVFDAHCPHLGAHLGHTGKVRAGELKCQFHGFGFDPNGRCVRTARGTPTRPITLRTWPSLESNGFVFAYHAGAVFGSRADPRASTPVPTWRIPELSDDGYGKIHAHSLRVRSHPQEMAENTVDLAHFGEVHGFRELEVIEPMRWQGPHMTCAYRMRVSTPWLDAFGFALRVEFRLHKWGLGYSLAEIQWPDIGLSARQFVFATPLDGEWVELNLAVCTRQAARSDSLVSTARRQLVANLARRILVFQFQRELQKDMAFWETKRYLARPALDASDGPIGEFRRYCRQFYPRLPQLPETVLPSEHAHAHDYVHGAV